MPASVVKAASYLKKFARFATFSKMSYALPMLETAVTTQARQQHRIEQLEKIVVDLSDVIGVVLNELICAGIPVRLPNRLKKLGGVASSVVDGTAPKAKHLAPATGGLASAKARGEAAKVDWVRSGEVVTAKTLSDAWGLTPQALGPAARRGELFAVMVNNQRYYPSEFLKLDRNDVGTVCKHLMGMDASEQLIFWKRKHGALGGKTVFEVATSRQNGPQIFKVVALAQAVTAHMRADATAKS